MILLSIWNIQNGKLGKYLTKTYAFDRIYNKIGKFFLISYLICRNLSFRIGINTVYRLCKLDGFPVIQIGGKKYILANDFNEWVMKNVGKVV